MDLVTRFLPDRKARTQWTCLLLALVTVAAYWPVRHHDFINFDDPMYVYDNAQVQQGLTWDGIVWAFTSDHAMNWHPVTWLSHMLDCQLFGVDAGAHHLVSVLFHATCTVLLFLVLTQLTNAPRRSALVAALFGLHPVHIESVAWIAERKDVLSAMFWLLTLWAYLHYVKRQTKAWYGLTLLLFALGLMSKPMVVTLPFVLLLLDYWPLRRWTWPTTARQLPTETAAGSGLRHSELSPLTPSLSPSDGERVSAGRVRGISSGPSQFHTSGVLSLRSLWQLVVEKWPFFALSAVLCVITYLMQRESAVIPVARISIPERVFNALVSYAAYVGKLLWPAKLSVFYPYPATQPIWEVLGAALLLVGVSILVIQRRRSSPCLLVGWCWFLGTLVPVIGLVQVGRQALADRYFYIPSIGLLMMVVWSLAAFAAGKHPRRLAVQAAALVILCAAFAATRWNLVFWQDSRSLWERALQVTTNNHVAHMNLGTYWASRNKPDQANEHFRQLLRLEPDHPEVHFNLANALARQGQISPAISAYTEALRLFPDYFNAHLNFGNLLLAQGRPADAQLQYEAALRVKPAHAGVHNNLGNALSKQGNLPEAIRHYSEALRLQPSYAEAHVNMGTTLAEQGKTKEALTHFAQALALDRTEPKTYNELGATLASEGRIPEAVECYYEALRLRPAYADAHLNLGFALVMLGHLDQAITHYHEAIRLNPADAKTYNNLGYALLQKTQTAAAAAAYEKALQLQPDLAPALNSLAWIMAAAPDVSLRGGAKAVRLAERACDLTRSQEPVFLKTLAAALAESSRFEEAAATAQKAQALAQRAGQASLSAELSEQIRLYQARQPFRTAR